MLGENTHQSFIFGQKSADIPPKRRFFGIMIPINVNFLGNLRFWIQQNSQFNRLEDIICKRIFRPSGKINPIRLAVLLLSK